MATLFSPSLFFFIWKISYCYKHIKSLTIMKAIYLKKTGLVTESEILAITYILIKGEGGAFPIA